ncbi:hypothetical protein F5884DRAFT_864267 [Xylogone sp. PMI_703]|nr:hypothetical protein F5884DRAFT_864267 [Xylogone sp. PMI_703]
MELQDDEDTSHKSSAAQIQALDQSTLLLGIALLDHALHGDIYNRVVVGFLAILGIGKDGSFYGLWGFWERAVDDTEEHYCLVTDFAKLIGRQGWATIAGVSIDVDIEE